MLTNGGVLSTTTGISTTLGGPAGMGAGIGGFAGCGVPLLTMGAGTGVGATERSVRVMRSLYRPSRVLVSHLSRTPLSTGAACTPPRGSQLEGLEPWPYSTL